MKNKFIRYVRVAIIAAAFIATSGPMWAQAASFSALQHKRFGYRDSRTGTFHPLGGHTAIVSGTTVTTPTTGVYQITVDISVVSTFAKGSTISCDGLIGASSVNIATFTGGYWTEEASIAATQSGSTATCIVNVPYSWLIPPPSSTVTDEVTGFLYISVSNGSAATSEERFSFLEAFSSSTLPANGATTKYTLKATL